MTSQHLLVAFHSTDKSLVALEWAINRARLEDNSLTIVHATELPVLIHNGPTAAVANRLGDPDWAGVHSIVQGLGAPPETVTIIDRGEPDEVISRYVSDDTVIVLGRRCRHRWSRRSTERLLAARHDVPIIRIEEHFAKVPLPDRVFSPAIGTATPSALPVDKPDERIDSTVISEGP